MRPILETGFQMNKNSQNIINPEVAEVFDSYPEEIKVKLMYLRQLLLDTAASIDEVGEIEETIRWGEPSYLTPKTKSGSTIRMAWIKSQPNQYAIYFICTTNLVEEFRERYPTEFKYGGNRCIIFNLNDDIPVKELKNCIALALTYHLNKRHEPSVRWGMVEKIT
jgi:hypothetical protein